MLVNRLQRVGVEWVNLTQLLFLYLMLWLPSAGLAKRQHPGDFRSVVGHMQAVDCRHDPGRAASGVGIDETRAVRPPVLGSLASSLLIAMVTGQRHYSQEERHGVASLLPAGGLVDFGPE
jgi:hypothetical protein